MQVEEEDLFVGVDDGESPEKIVEDEEAEQERDEEQVRREQGVLRAVPRGHGLELARGVPLPRARLRGARRRTAAPGCRAGGPRRGRSSRAS